MRSAFSASEIATILRVAPSTLTEWRKRGLIHPYERGHFHRDDVALGAVVVALQRVLGEKSPLVFEIAEQVRPKLAGWLRWNGTPCVPGPLAVEILDEDGVGVRLEIPAVVFEALATCLELVS